MAAHTEGPWRYGEGEQLLEGDRTVIADSRGRAICQCSGRNNVANAKLIAQAPETAAQRDELLAALEKIAALDKHSGSSLRDRAASEIARAAILRATQEGEGTDTI